jgi:hypothetical protein
MIEIPDDMVERAIEAGGYFSSAESRKHFRTILQAALDKRVGEADRRKVNDGFKDARLARRHSETGRRSTDVMDYDDLPLATEPEIPVSEGMIEAGYTTYLDWEAGPKRHAMTEAIYRAMESKRREEGGTPFVHFRKSDVKQRGDVDEVDVKPHRRRTDGIGGTDGA